MRGKERKGKERKGKERKGKEKKGKERKGKERKGKERKGKEKKGKERKGKERKGKGERQENGTNSRVHVSFTWHVGKFGCRSLFKKMEQTLVHLARGEVRLSFTFDKSERSRKFQIKSCLL
jgi:hypothetical protein